MNTLSQPARLGILGLYVAGLLFASRLALGAWLPPTSEKGLWFYSGLAAILLGSLLVTPFYTKPADAISYAVTALVALLAVREFASAATGVTARLLWTPTVVYVLCVLVFGIVAIAVKDSPRTFLQHASASLAFLADQFGAPRVLFSVLFLYAVVAYHSQSTRELFWIGLAWALLIAMRPLEAGANAISRLASIWWPTEAASTAGEIVGHETPGLVLIREDAGVEHAFGSLLVVPGDDGKAAAALVLDHVGFAEGRWLRAVQLNTPTEIADTFPPDSALQRQGQQIALTLSPQASMATIMDEVWTERSRMVGLVAPDSDISHLWVELVRTDLDLAEGRLLEVRIRERKALYQIINGLTREEIVEQKNRRGFVRAAARKIGSWDSSTARFDVVRWMPLPNSPVFLLQSAPPSEARHAIGYLPNTSYPVTVDMPPLVTHNTAILGILGAGKTYLALELIERMLASNVKVICLDLTNQYSVQLQPYYDQAQEEQVLNRLRSAGPPGKTNVQLNVEEGGSIEKFKTELRRETDQFLDAATSQKLRIINPADFEVWRQDSKPYNNRASMAMLTIAEVTRLITEVALEALQGKGLSDEPRCCLVFEEAHSLIREWNAVASEGDRTATNGTAKAILQGRKYGLGCMIVTQRTANVTKSILNQCNTVFALRVFDATGMEFLSNYIGSDYTSVLSALEERHAVAFGRGVSCRDPIIVRLNDREAFIRAFRTLPNEGASQ